jgi:hypothetical protein
MCSSSCFQLFLVLTNRLNCVFFSDRLLGNAVVVFAAIDTFRRIFNIDYHIASLLDDSLCQLIDDAICRLASEGNVKIHGCIVSDKSVFPEDFSATALPGIEISGSNVS